MKTLLLRAAAILSPFVATALFMAPAHAAPFTVFNLRPVQTYANAYTEILADFSSSSPLIDHCRLSVNGVNQGAMTLSATPSGTAAKVHFFPSAATYTVRVTCYDASEASSAYEEESMTVYADSSAPSLSAIYFNPTSIVAGSAVTISVDYDDTDFGSGLLPCTLFVDSANSGTMTLSGSSTAGTASKSYTFSTGGSHNVRIDCSDASGNVATRNTSVSVSAAPDTTPPTVGALSYGSLVLGSPITFQASVSDNVGVTSCNLNINGVHDGAMSISGGVASRSHTFTSAGTYSATARCFDAVGNSTEGPSVTFTFGSTDTAPPLVLSINPTSAISGSMVNVSASFTDNVGVISCDLYVNSVLAGAMSLTGTTAGTATKAYTFSPASNFSVQVFCRDSAGQIGNRLQVVRVTTLAPPSPYTNRLIKLMCPSGFVDVNHPCKAVYYVGSDNKRHAFPNERVYFTWYSNFDGIVELDGGTLAGITLGSNVNYRPGTRMVKFTTLNRVYAVARYGALRWVTSEGIATSLYGSAWNTRIDDINDAFYTDYTFGADINSSADYNPTAEAVAASTIDANLR